MVEVDVAVLLGLLGIILGGGSLIYARTQALAQHRQAEAANRLTEAEVNQGLAARVRDTRSLILTDPVLRKQYFDANPKLSQRIEEAGGIDAWVNIRNVLDHTEDIYFLRRAGIVADHVWNNWSGSVPAILQMPIAKSAYEDAAERGIYGTDFTAFLHAGREGKPLPDPIRASPPA